MNQAKKIPAKYLYYAFFAFVIILASFLLLTTLAYAKSKKISSEISYINVNDYGIIGDGKTDCSDTIESLLATSLVKNFYFPEGTYIIDSQVNIPSNTHIKGSSNTTTFIAKKGTPRGANVFKIRKASDIVLEDICISGNSDVNYENMDSSGGIILLEIWDSERISISNCKFIDNISVAIIDVGSNNISVNNCLFSKVDCGFETLGRTNVHDLYITNNTFDGHNSSEPISLYADASHTNVTIENNIIRNKPFACGIYIGGKQPNSGITINNNNVTNCAGGIKVQNTTDLSIQNNNISNTSSGYGIKMIGCTNSTLDNNTCSNTKQDGIYIKDCSTLSITKLNTTDCGQIGNEYFNVRVTGTHNDNVSISNSKIEYSNRGNKIGICIACKSEISISDMNFVNATIRLTKDASNSSLRIPNSIKKLVIR